MITTASVFMAVILSLVMRSMQLGSYQHMIDNIVHFYSGHIQIHKNGYNEDKVIDNSFVLNDSLKKIINDEPAVENWVPRLESFALSSSGDLTRGAMIVGVDPDAEDKLTRLKNKIISGNYFSADDNAVLISQGLAEYLKLKVNDTIVLLGQGYHGVTAAGKFPVKGILLFPSPDLNKGTIYLPLKRAQDLYNTGEQLTSIAILLKDHEDATLISKRLKSSLKNMPYEVLDWKEILPEMVQLIAVDNMGGLIVISVLYLIIAFGIFGTLLMMLAERMHEFGILVSIGMGKLKLAVVVVLEAIMISGLGVLAGVLGGIPIVNYFNSHPIRISGEAAATFVKFGMEPIFPFSNDISIFGSQALVVFIISVILSLYPFIKILKLDTINALKD